MFGIKCLRGDKYGVWYIIYSNPNKKEKDSIKTELIYEYTRVV